MKKNRFFYYSCYYYAREYRLLKPEFRGKLLMKMEIR